MSRLERCKIAYGRVAETDDDELAYAYYSANLSATTTSKTYDRRSCARAYARRSVKYYDFKHVRSAAHMILTAADINPTSKLSRLGIWAGWKVIQRRQRQLHDAPTN
jgi:hypothetical protein